MNGAMRVDGVVERGVSLWLGLWPLASVQLPLWLLLASRFGSWLRLMDYFSSPVWYACVLLVASILH